MEKNIFNLLKIEHKENFHSRFITAIIENDESAKKKFLEMLEKVSGKDFISSGTCGKFKFKNEKNLSGKNGRSDIYITDYEKTNPKNVRIIIENKIYAADQREQLFRYHNHLTSYANYALFYLTLEGKDASTYSKKSLEIGLNYHIISYKNISAWLKTVLSNKEIVLDKKLIVYIEDYLEIIDKLTAVSDLIDNDFQSNNKYKVEKNAFNAHLEFVFWEFLKTNIGKLDSSIKISSRRLYNYDKISTTQNESNRKVKPRDYGIIFELNDSFEIRIGVKAQEDNKFQIFISRGKMDTENNKWRSESSHPLEYKTNELHNRRQMEEIATKIILELQNHYQFPNRIED